MGGELEGAQYPMSTRTSLLEDLSAVDDVDAGGE